MPLDSLPEIDPKDDVQVWLCEHWRQARIALHNERAKGQRAHNVGAVIAGHKMAWLKELIRERRKS